MNPLIIILYTDSQTGETYEVATTIQPTQEEVVKYFNEQDPDRFENWVTVAWYQTPEDKDHIAFILKDRASDMIMSGMIFIDVARHNLETDIPRCLS